MGEYSMFINVSNHPSARWGAEQRAAAEQWGEIVDLAFPNIAPEADTQSVATLAAEYYARIAALAQETPAASAPVQETVTLPAADTLPQSASTQIPSGSAGTTIMVSGEFTFTYHLVALLLQGGYRVVSACTRREAEEQIMPDGSSIKTARFVFVQFREY